MPSEKFWTRTNSSGSDVLHQPSQIAQYFTGAIGHGGERIVGDDHRQPGLVTEETVDAPDKGATTGQNGVAEGLAKFLRGDMDGLG